MIDSPFIQNWQKIYNVWAVLMVVLLGTATAVVYHKHLSRTLYADLQELTKKQAHLNARWSQLVLEKSAWSTDSRVEQVARNKLSMILPEKQGVIKP